MRTSQRSRSFARIRRGLRPTPHITACSASSKAPLSGLHQRRPSIFICSIAGSMALCRRSERSGDAPVLARAQDVRPLRFVRPCSPCPRSPWWACTRQGCSLVRESRPACGRRVDCPAGSACPPPGLPSRSSQCSPSRRTRRAFSLALEMHSTMGTYKACGLFLSFAGRGREPWV